MAQRINIQYIVADARAEAKKKYFQSLGLKNRIKEVCLVDSYSLDAKLTPAQTEAARKLLTNRLLEKSSLKTLAPKRFDYAIEIGFLPGVTDNVGNTAKETIADGIGKTFKPGEEVYSSQVFFIELFKNKNRARSAAALAKADASTSDKSSSDDILADIKKIAESLHNPLIQKATITGFTEFKKQGGLKTNVPKVKLEGGALVLNVNLNIPDEELAKLGKEGVMDPKGFRRGPLSLDLDSLKAIRNHFHKLGRQPTDVELESLAQTWSEHCKHTIFADPLDELDKGIYKTYIKRATEIVRQKKASEAKSGRGRGHSTGGDFCVSVFSDNSGGIIFDDNYLITHKVETHNSPSALDPFGGAITGIVGVNRDALGFGQGAKPVINYYGFCFADPRDNTVLYRNDPKTQRESSEASGEGGKMLSARRIMEGVIAGVNAGGNQSGIPTPQGFVCFDHRFRGKPLVFVGTVGLIPRKINNKPGHCKKAQPGDYIVMAGGRVGQDGIHGATFSSETLTSGSPATAVQIGDPITQKKMSDALVKEARDLGLYNSITDDGAGGLSSSVAEMAEQAGGCEVNLDKVPVKYPGLAPWQIWISESQERMTLAVPPKKWNKFQALMQKRGVEATVIGKFTSSGKCVIKYGKKTVMYLEMDFLHNGRPIKYQVSCAPLPSSPLMGEDVRLRRTDEGDKIFKSFNHSIFKLLSSPNIASFSFISQQYDHEVQGGSVTKPLQGKGRVNADASVTRPVLDSKKGVVLSQGILPWYSDINTYHMAASAIDSAIRSAVAAGANPDNLAILDNFCWYSGNDPVSLARLKDAAKACFDYAVAFGTPFISGKDSMFNDFKGFDENGDPIKISVPPTLLISAIGVADDAKKSVTIDAKFAGDVIYLLGETDDELGASEYENMINTDQGKRMNMDVPHVDAAKNLKLYRALAQAIQKEMVASAISLTRGGLAVALAKTLMAGDLGAAVDLNLMPGDAKEDLQRLFSESQGRVLVTVNPKFAEDFERLMKGNAFAKIGTVTEKKDIVIKGKDGKKVADIKLADALKAYRSTFKDY